MRLSEKKTALATRCLWSLQETITEIDGLLLSHIDGLTLTSTMDGGDSTQRLAAVTTALFRLGDEASELWGRGASQEMQVKLNDDGVMEYVFMRPVGRFAILTAVSRQDLPVIHRHLVQAADYLDAVLRGESPDLPEWHV